MYSESFFCIRARRSQALPLPTGVLQRPETQQLQTCCNAHPQTALIVLFYLKFLHLIDRAGTDENRAIQGISVQTVTDKFSKAITASLSVFVVTLKVFP